jgi:hypothetical protein
VVGQCVFVSRKQLMLLDCSVFVRTVDAVVLFPSPPVYCKPHEQQFKVFSFAPPFAVFHSAVWEGRWHWLYRVGYSVFHSCVTQNAVGINCFLYARQPQVCVPRTMLLQIRYMKQISYLYVSIVMSFYYEYGTMFPLYFIMSVRKKFLVSRGIDSHK